jgi:hypothetical protein
MNNDSANDYQQLLTETLQKQMVILGPTITLAKARQVAGLHVTDDGRVTSIEGNPQEVSIKLLEQFRELSPLMVKKTMRPLLNAIISSYPRMPEPQMGHAAEGKSEDEQEKKPEEQMQNQQNQPEQSKEPEQEKPHEENHQSAPQQPAAV